MTTVSVVHGVAARHFASIMRTNNSGVVRDYFDKFLPTSKDVLLHQLMGPKVGADVNHSSSLLTELFLVSPASLFL